MHHVVLKKRRKEFLRRITDAGGGLVVLPAARETQRNHGVEHEFRQESNFYYLTGLEQPGALAVFNPRSKKPYTLFVHERDPKKDVWVGASVGPEEAVRLYAADQGLEVGSWKAEVGKFLDGSSQLWHRTGTSPTVDRTLQEIMDELRYSGRGGKSAPEIIRDPYPVIAELRLIKSKDEIANIQKAVDITAHGLRQCLAVLRPGLKEYQLRAQFEHAIRWRGVVRHAYPPIICSGPGTCILHNPNDRATIKKDALVLIDAGAEWNYYAADITRTVPASGRFTKEQRVVYEIVLEAQERAISMVKPGATWDQLETSTREFMTKQLVRQKVFSQQSTSFPRKRESRKKTIVDPGSRSGMTVEYMPHKLGHWLGLDVHDVGAYMRPSLRGAEATKQSRNVSGSPRAENSALAMTKKEYSILDRPFAPGMVLTIEPGIYLPKTMNQSINKSINPEYWNIGIRIEDDILVTRSGSKNLSSAIPKEPEALERLIRHLSRHPRAPL